jgi:hypothetical protein
MTEHINLKNVLESVICFMEIAEELEEGKLLGESKKEYVMLKMKEKLGMLLPSYEFEIQTIIETTIFLSRLGRKIHINDISKNCNTSCFKFL